MKLRIFHHFLQIAYEMHSILFKVKHQILACALTNLLHTHTHIYCLMMNNIHFTQQISTYISSLFMHLIQYIEHYTVKIPEQNTIYND